MDTSDYEDQMAEYAGLFKRLAIPILIVSALLTVALSAHLLLSPPEFRTDLNDFAPDKNTKKAQTRLPCFLMKVCVASRFMLWSVCVFCGPFEVFNAETFLSRNGSEQLACGFLGLVTSGE